jgi:hypothetical protein
MPHPVVLLPITERCTTMAPPTHPDSRSNTSTSTRVSSSSGLYLHHLL